MLCFCPVPGQFIPSSWPVFAYLKKTSLEVQSTFHSTINELEKDLIAKDNNKVESNETNYLKKPSDSYTSIDDNINNNFNGINTKHTNITKNSTDEKIK